MVKFFFFFFFVFFYFFFFFFLVLSQNEVYQIDSKVIFSYLPYIQHIFKTLTHLVMGRGTILGGRSGGTEASPPMLYIRSVCSLSLF